MKYHLEAVKLLGSQPRAGETAQPGLPEAVAEWYAFEGAVELLAQYSNNDRPLSPNEFKTELTNNRETAVFMIENQGVCWWAFEQDAGEDPPVYVIHGSIPPNWTQNWAKCCDRFSTFIYTRLFDYRYWGDEHRSKMEIGVPIDEQFLNSLREEYRIHPTTHGWPGDTQYRFSKDDLRIVLWESEWQTDWNFSADSPHTVDETYQKYKHLFY